MKTQSSDTAPDVEAYLFERYRALGLEEKMAIVGGLGRMLEAVVLAGIRARHPGAGEREQRLRMAALYLDRDTMVAAFGWDPELEVR